MSADLTCRDERRRQHIREHRPHNGIDYVEVKGRHLCVHFLTGVPEVFTTEEETLAVRRIVIKGGRRIRDIRALSLDAHATPDTFDEDCLGIEVDRSGDWSTYTLCFVELDENGRPTDVPMQGLDPRYRCVEFSFKIDCPAEIDCKQDDACPTPPPSPRTANYLAKDYTTFRQLILDRLSLTMPEWRERHIPDLGITVVELLAYVADYLSYYQDAVATEAYLDTARHRISVRRHTRLVDYLMHEGCNARAFVHVTANADAELDPEELFFTTDPGEGKHETFEPLTGGAKIHLRKAHNAIAIYTWGNEECCLPKGATRATLAGPLPDLAAGDFLLFEELACAGTVSDENFDGTTPMPDADPSHRHVVRLTNVETSADPLFDDKPLVEVEWGREDALPFMLCVSAVGKPPECDQVDGLAVARGNMVLVDHGQSVFDEPLAPVPERPFAEVCEGEDDLSEIPRMAGRYRPTLKYAPLTFAQPLIANASAAQLLHQDARAALPSVRLAAIPPSFAGEPLFDAVALRDPRSLAGQLQQPEEPAMISLRNRLRSTVVQLLDTRESDDPDLLAALRENLRALLDAWTPRTDLLDSSRDDAEFVAEIDDDGRAHLRFGDGVQGRAIETGTAFLATYRAGNGRAGLVGAETITHAAFRNATNNAIAAVRNPLAASGAIEPESVEEVRMLAPHAVRNDLQRAIVAEDYATLAQYTKFPARNTSVQSASANLRWNGSWYEASVAVDPYASATVSRNEGAASRTTQTGSPSSGVSAPHEDESLHAAVAGTLQRYRRMGHDLRVGAATYVPLFVQISICVDPDYLRAHVVQAARAALRAFFHPDNLTFSGTVYGSRIIALVQNLDGVTAVKIDRLERLDARTVDATPLADPNAAYPPKLILGTNEVARLDNDPVIPENGILRIEAGGGR